MLISHTKRFIFAKIPKTASTSIEAYLIPYCAPIGTVVMPEPTISNMGVVGCNTPLVKLTSHAPIREIKQYTNEYWDQYFKFCSIRNPFDMCVSWFFFSKHVCQYGEKRFLDDPLIKFHQDPPTNDIVLCFREWFTKFCGWFNLKRYYAIDGKVCVDYFVRYETLAEDLNWVCTKLDIPFKSDQIQHINAHIRPTNIFIQDLYDKATIEIVERVFAWELEYFDYKMPKSA